MTIHIYQAQLLHYLTQDDYDKRIARTNSESLDDLETTIVQKNITLLPVVAGVTVYPEYIAKGALVVDDAPCFGCNTYTDTRLPHTLHYYQYVSIWSYH